MVLKCWMLGFLTLACLGQALPDRDKLVKQFLNESNSVDAARELIKHFQMGGLRTIIRNISKLPLQKRLQYGELLRHFDLMRFRNDLNTNLDRAKDPSTRGMNLMLLATIGRNLEPSVFEPYLADESAHIRVRLAAASGLVKVQKPGNYDRFLQLANSVVMDAGSGRNDLVFADISKSNLGFYIYTKSQIDQKSVQHGAIVTAIAMCENDSGDVYETILDLKKRKYVPQMIDRAIKVGGVNLLEIMAQHKTSKKKFAGEIAKALEAARVIARYRGKFLDKQPAQKLLIGPLFPRTGTGTSAESGYRAAYAVARIDASGQVSLAAHQAPFGTSDNLKDLIKGVTLPAYLDWEPVECYILVVAP